MASRPSPVWIALLRGVNVGRAKRVAMADLRALVESLGYGAVKTLLNSGNIVFATRAGDARDHAARIEKAMAKELGLSSRVTVLTAAELAAIVDKNPLLTVADNPSRLLVTVVRDSSDMAKLKALAKQDWGPEALAIGRRAAYSWCPEGILVSELAAKMGRSLGDGVTTCNWATMTKLRTLLGGGA